MAPQQRFIFIFSTASGHTNPSFPIARHLVKRGHSVTYLSSSNFRAAIEATGAVFVDEATVLTEFFQAADNYSAASQALMAEFGCESMPFHLQNLNRTSPKSCLAPAGELLGASLLAFGLRLHSTDLGGPFATLLLCLGFLSISACKAGVSIAEFSTVGCASGAYSAFGFSAMVLAKHAFVMVMDWSVPKVLATTHDAMLGLFRVQFFLLAPHAISVAAGLALSRVFSQATSASSGSCPVFCAF